MKRPFHTVDGKLIHVGMTVFIHNTDVDQIEQYTVDRISDNGRKVYFANPHPDGYVGARVDGLYATRFGVEEKRKQWLLDK